MKKNNKIVIAVIIALLIIVIVGLSVVIGVLLTNQSIDKGMAGISELAEQHTEALDEETTLTVVEEAVENSDEVKILTHNLTREVSGYFDISYRVQNNTKHTINFETLCVIEYDSNGDVIHKYETRNKAYTPTALKPQQSVYIEQTYSDKDNIAKIEMYGYILSDGNENETTGEFTTPYIINIQ